MPRSSHSLRSIAQIAGQCLPPLIFQWIASRYGRVRYVGYYNSWQQAASASDGYDNQLILNCVRQATDKVLSGQAMCERDGVALDHADYPWPVIYALQRAALANGGKLHVTDFGGSLGSTYRLLAPLLERQIDLKWSVIEQAHFVETGQQHYMTDGLDFHADIMSCHAVHCPHVLLLSCVLPYLPSPFAMLKQLLEMNYSMVIIERTMFLKTTTDRLAVQRIPSSFYGRKISYPVWLLSLGKLLSHMSQAGYQLTLQTDANIDTSHANIDRHPDQSLVFELRTESTSHA